MGKNIVTILYYVLVLFCVSISVYLSYFGYLSSFSNLALPFTLVIGIGLLGADLLIQRARVTGSNIWPPLLLFFVFAIFSAASNFNFLYTNFMEKDVVKHALDSQYALFRDNLTSTRSRLTEVDSYTFTEQKRVELDRELARLRTQVLDELRPGCGERCQLHLSNIEELLGKPLTDLAIPSLGSPSSAVDSWYERVRTAVLSDFQKLSETNEFPQIEKLISYIDGLLLKYDTADRALARSVGLPVLRKLSEESQEVERRANSLLPADSTVEHDEIDVTLGRLGEIVYSLVNGFVQRPNPAATVLSTVLSIIIDIFPVLFALVAFRPDTTRIHRSPPRRGRAGTILD